VAREGEGSFKWFLIASPGACLLLLLGGKPFVLSFPEKCRVVALSGFS